ncbi:MAG: universal stress protein [Gammaproteobacteria bacterium]|nr:universal stress protein [Gammaproteobacteria bacterium]NIR83249.1 universal stress protein [Gammaproteobacteria bacterium]NIR91053.1 universal stress protein [Gammaproteobacteria bacterium]NIU04414.1 universal stress protein [Gammaproteobacteria bacterium]NIV76369.1 universal stress protein [Gammaproteobacteria bacterium]
MKIEWVFHPSDFSDESVAAFQHALMIAVRCRAGIGMLHAVPDALDTRHWGGFPGVRRTLHRWGLIGADAPREAVRTELGVTVNQLTVESRDPVQAIGDYLTRHGADLMVLATEGRMGLPRWLKPSVAEPAARRSRIPTLFIAKGAHGFVSPEGSVRLAHLLVPVDHDPAPQTAVNAAADVARLLGAFDAALMLLHVQSDERTPPSVDVPAAAGWAERVIERGPVLEAIMTAAESLPADLIVMATSGRNGFLDAVFGSTTEQVLRRAPCPVLAVPVS